MIVEANNKEEYGLKCRLFTGARIKGYYQQGTILFFMFEGLETDSRFEKRFSQLKEVFQRLNILARQSIRAISMSKEEVS